MTQLSATLRTKQAAAYLGLSVNTLVRLRKAGELTPKRVGKQIHLYRIRDLDRWLGSNRRVAL